MTIRDERQKRIFTTHVGSLPRPDALSETMAEGKTQDTTFAKSVREAVAQVVKRQADCGIGIVEDGLSGFRVLQQNAIMSPNPGSYGESQTTRSIAKPRRLRSFPRAGS